MRWFSGSITEAVVTSKAKGAVFVVFVEGTDEASKSTAAAIETQEVSSSLESSDFVAIKLGSGTEEYKQFTEIYRIVPIPSIFFIGGDGRPIEIVAGSSSVSDIVQRIAVVLGKTKGEQSVPAPKQNDLQKPEISETTDASSSGASEESSTLAAERLEKAKALLERTRALKLAEEAAKEKEREDDRRRVGREVQELRRWQQDQEMKQMKEDREREKREDLAARERVKKQIESDKAERARRSREAAGQAEPAKPAPAAASVVTPTVSNSNTARLQLRLPDGSTAVTTLAATDSLSRLRIFAAESAARPATQFTLSTAFPRRELSPDMDAMSMAELELTPTAVVLVLPVASSGAVRSSSASIVTPLTALFWSLLAPVISLATYFRGWLSGGGAPRAGGQSGAGASRIGGQAAGGARTGQSGGGQALGAGPGRREPPTAQIRRQGNVHRLTTARDSSDDETNTWNGNSTQQM